MQNKFRSAIYLTAILAISWSCSSDKKVDTAAVRKELNDREIKKATEAEIISKVHEIGNSIVLQTQQTLGKNLQNALQTGGVENAIEFCNLNAMPLVDSLNKHLDTRIRRVTFKARNQGDLPDSIESAILKAYAFQSTDSVPKTSNVQSMDDKTFLFTKPIIVENALCLTCHGEIGNGMAQETDDYIKSLYPEDQASGYQIGDLRGMWSIRISRKKAVQSL